jgi:hypothetical protein
LIANAGIGQIQTQRAEEEFGKMLGEFGRLIVSQQSGEGRQGDEIAQAILQFLFVSPRMHGHWLCHFRML